MKTEEQLMKVKIKFLEDRVKVLDKAVGRINQILGRFQMTENNEQSAFSDLDIKNIREDIEHELI